MEPKTRKDQLLKMLELEPDDVFLNYALAMEYLAIDSFEIAAQMLEKTLSLKQDYLPCYYQLGQVNEKLNNEKLAIHYYESGIIIAEKQGNKKALGELKEALWLLED